MQQQPARAEHDLKERLPQSWQPWHTEGWLTSGQKKKARRIILCKTRDIFPAITLHSQPCKNWLNNSPMVSLFICIYGCVTNYLCFHQHTGTYKPRLCTRAGTLPYQFCKAFCWWPKHSMLALRRLGKWHDLIIHLFLFRGLPYPSQSL